MMAKGFRLFLLTATVCSVVVAVGAAAGCVGRGAHLEREPTFDDQLAVMSPHDEGGGRFDGARISPGFGVLYLNGYTATEPEDPRCGGYFGEEPEHVLEVDSSMTIKLVVHSDDDLALAVRSPDGEWRCWDDESRSNANVSLEAAYLPGSYEVWVGPRRAQTHASYRLVISE